ncbi:MAG: sulfoxide reductase heme-binding subunit YedZ [Proteobacteria bacterium]|nr:sulfoxide reductase heme-binding subunit YedZ [Pseudomonadota bacterium]
MKSLFAFKAALFALCLAPLARLVFFAFTDRLGANPIEFVLRSLGTWTLTLLLVTLSITPLRRLSGWNSLIRVRRMLGLFAFFYACLHFLTYAGVDQSFDLSAILADIVKRPYITIGFTCFVLLIPLAATSTNAMQRWLGGKRWQQLHRLIYLIAVGGVVHYLWLVKKDITLPVLYGLVLAVLLGIRFAWRRRVPAVQAAVSRPPG